MVPTTGEFSMRQYYGIPIRDQWGHVPPNGPEYLHMGTYDGTCITLRIGTEEVIVSADDLEYGLHASTNGRNGKKEPAYAVMQSLNAVPKIPNDVLKAKEVAKQEKQLEIPNIDLSISFPSNTELAYKVNELVDAINTLKRTYIHGDKK